MLDQQGGPSRTFVEVAEVWVPNGEDRLVWEGGDYGDLHDFRAVSGQESFAKGEGLPGKAWAEGRPVVLKGFEGSYFKRTEAAHAAGLTAAVAVPVFAGDALKAVLVTLCADDEDRIGAIEIWAESAGVLKLDDGYFGAARHFEWVSRHSQFPKGQGLPGRGWGGGSGYKFIRAESAGQAGLTAGLGLPIPVPGGGRYVVTMLSARGTPIARRFEIWAVTEGKARLIDGLCAAEETLDLGRESQRAEATDDPVGQVLATGRPIAARQETGLPAGYRSVVALPIHVGDTLAHVVAWYG